MTAERLAIEVDEFPGGDPRGRTQRQLAIRDANLRRLGCRVLRVPDWQVHLDPAATVRTVRKAMA